jgi:excisionase family DNA binding protein
VRAADLLGPELIAAIEDLVDERVEAALVDREASNVLPPPVLTLKEAAEYLHVSERLVQRLIARGELRPIRIGRRVLLHRVELDAFLERGGEEG